MVLGGLFGIGTVGRSSGWAALSGSGGVVTTLLKAGEKPQPGCGSAGGETAKEKCPTCSCYCDKLASRTVSDDTTLPSVADVNLFLEANTKEHKTSEYHTVEEEGQLVVRRGQNFAVEFKFEKELELGGEFDLKLAFGIGPNQIVCRGTKEFLMITKEKLNANLDPTDWGIKIDTLDGKSLILNVMAAVDCPVGRWDCTLIARAKKGSSGEEAKCNSYKLPKGIHILYNAWCSADVVYMPREDDRDEYVLNDFGKIWRGSSWNFHPKNWHFGQFEKDILECSEYLLDLSGLKHGARGNAIEVTRAISKVVNACDENGVLIGNWSGEYAGGTKPSTWKGSVHILQQYWRSRAPVKYGQCWVFSGLVTTVSRALGLPTRSVTNFKSAHDTNNSVTIDHFYDEEMEELDSMGADSVWNFHVWNEIWMARADLPKGYGGWQAFDATPQELSGGEYKCGPASVAAIRRGEVGFLYDAPFIFAEVNADVVHWKVDVDNDMTVMKCYSDRVGAKMSTKAPGRFLQFGNADRLDVTLDYKPQDRSGEERATVMTALLRSGSSYLKHFVDNDAKDVLFELDDKAEVMIGKDIRIPLKIKNTSTEFRTVMVRMALHTTFYTGVTHKVVVKDKTEVGMKPGAETECVLSSTADDYLYKLTDQAMFCVFATARVQETEQVFCGHDDFRVIKPDITIKVKAGSVAKVGEKLSLECEMTNPLPVALHEVIYSVEGPMNEEVFVAAANVPAGGKSSCVAIVTPRKSGRHCFVVNFDSKELDDVDGSIQLEVTR